MSTGEGARRLKSATDDKSAVDVEREENVAAAEMADILPKRTSASEGRDRASATTFSAPERWRMSVVNSEMKERCLV